MTSEELLREENDDVIYDDEMTDTIDGDGVIELEERDLKMGLIFKNEESAVKSIHLWSEKTFCPLAKVSLYLYVQSYALLDFFAGQISETSY